MRNMFLQFCTSQNSNLFVRAQMFAFSYRFDQGRVKHEGHTINPEIAPTAGLLHAKILELHASGKAKAQSKSAAVAVSCWKQSVSETNDLLSLTHLCSQDSAFSRIVTTSSWPCFRASSNGVWPERWMLIAPHSWVLMSFQKPYIEGFTRRDL